MSESNQPNRSDDSGGDSRQSKPSMKMSRGVFGWVVIVSFILMLLMLLSQNMNSKKPMTISEFNQKLEAGEIKSVTLRDHAVEGTRELIGDQVGANPEFSIKWPNPMDNKELLSRLEKYLTASGGKWEYKPSSTLLITVLINLLPWVVLVALFWFLILRPMRAGGGAAGMLGNFGRSRHRLASKEHTNITFDDVAGIDEAKEEVAEIIEFLSNPRKFQRIGGRIPRGILLIGQPGCGKTLLAKAIAGEADVPFYSISGSDFVEMFVGVGASRVRDLFKSAKENSPCIIFLDEIDAVGRRRGAGFSAGGHDEREQTLNAILVEMDGFETNDQVIVIAATNRADVLDPALVRPGRFDRQVDVPAPDVKGRFEILKVHAHKVKLGPDVDLQRTARATPGFSGADLAAVINESALIATMENKDFIEMEDLEEARDKVRWGRARKSRVIDEEDRQATAYHEAGHAVVQLLLAKHSDPLHKVSILPRGQSLGATYSLPEKDRLTHSRNWMMAQLRISCAGRIAEEMFRNDVNSGVLSDIRQATQIARTMVAEFGMNSDLGFVYYGEDERDQFFGIAAGRNYSEETARKIDAEVKKLMDEAYADTTRMLQKENKDKLERVAKALLKYETLDGDEVIAIMRGEELRKSTIGELLDEAGGKPAAPQAQAQQPEPQTPEAPLGPDAMPQPS